MHTGANVEILVRQKGGIEIDFFLLEGTVHSNI
jgi:hypothetical protein